MQLRIAAGTATFAVIALLLGSASRAPDRCEVTLRLVDADTGETLPGLVRAVDADGKAVELPGLLSRGTGLGNKLPIGRWSVLPGSTTLQLPKKKLTFIAFSGLETEQATVEVDLSSAAKKSIGIKLKRFYDASARGFRSANTHLHLQKISRKDCDRYLREVPKADGLDALFVSYLERAVADREYTSNRYRKADLQAIGKTSGVVMGNGEEHRHNFTGFGQGFGHVMLLDIKRLIQPVSIGPGIMKIGTDGIPLQRGIDTARKDGATILWCHNNWGMEAVPNFLTGRVDAQNIFDGGTHGSYKDSFYRYLNAGLRVPFSTGTDWFMYDFSRVYCDMRADLGVMSWLAALAAGRSYITNGPLLEFSVDGRSLGETVALRKPGTVTVKARALGRANFGRIELIRNGKVIATFPAKKIGGHYEAEASTDVKVGGPCWLALRTPPPPVKDDPQLQTPVAKNALGRELFAHTSAISISVDGKSHFDRTVARQLLAEMRQNRATILKRGRFKDAVERGRVLDVYDDGIAAMRKRLKRD